MQSRTLELDKNFGKLHHCGGLKEHSLNTSGVLYLYGDRNQSLSVWIGQAANVLQMLFVLI